MSALTESQAQLIDLFAEIYERDGRLSRWSALSSCDVWHAMSTAGIKHDNREAINEVFERLTELWGVDICYRPEQAAERPTKNNRKAVDGFVYVLRNPSLPGLVKIGFTAGSVAQRVKQLSRSTSIPTSFEIVREFSCAFPADVEAKIHTDLSMYRMAGSEFFKVPEALAIACCNEILGGDL